jgi:CRP-like cAMP-binding protein
MTDLDVLPLLATLSHTQRAAVAGIGTLRTYPPGYRLFDEGSVADRCWIVVTGHVALDMLDPRDGRVVLHAIGPGGLLSWSWNTPSDRWNLGATVVSPTRAVVVDTRDVRALAEDDPALGRQLSLIQLDALLVLLEAVRTRWLDRPRRSP